MTDIMDASFRGEMYHHPRGAGASSSSSSSSLLDALVSRIGTHLREEELAAEAEAAGRRCLDVDVGVYKTDPARAAGEERERTAENNPLDRSVSVCSLLSNLSEERLGVQVQATTKEAERRNEQSLGSLSALLSHGVEDNAAPAAQENHSSSVLPRTMGRRSSIKVLLSKLNLEDEQGSCASDSVSARNNEDDESRHDGDVSKQEDDDEDVEKPALLGSRSHSLPSSTTTGAAPSAPPRRVRRNCFRSASMDMISEMKPLRMDESMRGAVEDLFVRVADNLHLKDEEAATVSRIDSCAASQCSSDEDDTALEDATVYDCDNNERRLFEDDSRFVVVDGMITLAETDSSSSPGPTTSRRLITRRQTEPHSMKHV